VSESLNVDKATEINKRLKSLRSNKILNPSSVSVSAIFFTISDSELVQIDPQ
jgi:hypothetical protein